MYQQQQLYLLQKYPSSKKPYCELQAAQPCLEEKGDNQKRSDQFGEHFGQLKE